MERCQRCIMPAHIPSVSLDSEGVCRYCRRHDQTLSRPQHGDAEAQQKRLHQILNRYRGRKPFDCIIGLSGGKDSTFLLNLAVTRFDMHPLVFNLDNGYRSPDAIKNIEETVNRLGVDLIVVKPNPKVMRQLQRIFLLNAGEFCTPCLMHIDGIAEALSKKYRIKLGISGCDDTLDSAIEGLSIAKYFDRPYYFNTIGSALPRCVINTFCKKPYIQKALGRILGFEGIRR